MWFILRYLCLATVVLCIEQPRVENVEQVKQRFHFRRAVDGRRGRKYFNYEDDGAYDSYGSEDGYYDSSQVKSGFADIRSNVPGEPGVDYPVYESVPKTSFSCQGRVQGYYADVEAGCQAFHVCNSVVVASFICPVGCIFSQQLLTCDWWNKVDCGMADVYYSSPRGIYTDENKMIREAMTMAQLPERTSMKIDSDIGIKQMETTNIGLQESTADAFQVGGKEFLAASRGRETQYYNNNPTQQFGVYDNLEFGRNRAVSDGNVQPGRNIINFNVRPKDFEVNHQGQNSRLNNRAKDSSITFIQRNVNYNSQDSYSTLRPSTFGNYFENSYQPKDKIVRNQFQPSYAPTVPTVTTTMRRLYSPTVPTTYRPSTTSDNIYDQYFQSSDHFYTHGRNLLTTSSTMDYDDAATDDSSFEITSNQEASDFHRIPKNKGRNEYNLGEIVHPEASIGIAQRFGKNLNNDGNHDIPKAEAQTGPKLRSGESKEQNTYIESSGLNLENAKTHSGTKRMEFNSNVSGDQQRYQHFYSNLLALGTKNDEQVTAQVNSSLADNFTQVYGIDNIKNGQNADFITSRLGVAPLIVQIPRPMGPSGRPVTDIADQLFSFDSIMKMSASPSQTTEPELPPRIDFVDTTNRINSFDSSTRIPLLIPQTSQSAVSPGAQSPSLTNDDDKIFDSSSKIPPLISQISLPTGSSGMGSGDVVDRTQAFESPTRIPPLIPQTSQSTLSGGAQFPSLTNDRDEIFDSPSRIPPLISQISQTTGSSEMGSGDVVDRTQAFESPTRIPPLIPQTSQSTLSGGAQFPSLTNDGDEIFDFPSRIPPLISQISQTTGSSEMGPGDFVDRTQGFESATRIPPLIPQTSQSTLSGGAQFPSLTNDGDEIFDSPSRIPPLIYQISQTTGSSEMGSGDVVDRTQAFESPTRIPPLIPQTSQSAVSPAVQSPSLINGDDDIFESPSRIPPLISQISQTTGSSEMGPGDVVDRTQGFESATRIPPLIPQTSQSAVSPAVQSPSLINGDDDIFESPSRIPPLISQISQTTGSSEMGSGDVADRTQAFESASRIPPLIPQTSQSTVSGAAQFPSLTNDGDKIFDSPSRIPPLISQISQTTGSSEMGSGDVVDRTQAFESPTRIPPLIPQTSQSAVSPAVQSPSLINGDDDIFESPSRIPPLISQISQTTGSSEMGSGDVADRTQAFESASRIPPLIPQTSQSTVSGAAQFPSLTNDGDKIFDFPSRIPQLIPQTSQTTGSSEMGSGDVADRTQAFESATTIPQLIPQTSQSAQSPSLINDDGIFDSSSRIPPLISQISLTTGSSGMGSGDAAGGTLASESATSIPPLIPQTPQSTVSPAVLSPSLLSGDDEIFDSPSRIPPLISQMSLSGMGSGDAADRPQAFESAPTIPQLIPQTSQSAISGGAQFPSQTNDGDRIFDSPSRIPPLISQTSQTTGSAEMGSGDSADRTQAIESANSIPLLIPQTSQSAQSPSRINDNSIFDSSSRIPPLISQVSLTTGSSGIGSAGAAGPTQASESATSIPQIPQSSQPVLTDAQTSSELDNDKTFDSPSRIPPLIPQVSQSVGSLGLDPTNIYDRAQTSESSATTPSFILELEQPADNGILDSSSRIPPLIPQSSQSIGSSGLDSIDVDNQTQSSESSATIPPLIPQVSQSVPASAPQPPIPIDDDEKTSDSPSRLPPLISQISQSFETSEQDLTGVNDQTQIHQSSTSIPPLIVQTSQSVGPSAAQLPSLIDDDNKTFDSSSEITPLIFQISQSSGSSELNFTDVDDQTQTFESSAMVAPLIPQYPQSAESSGSDSPTMTDDNKTLDSPSLAQIPLLISRIPQTVALSGVDSTDIDHQTQNFTSSLSMPPLIIQFSQSTESTGPVHHNNTVDPLPAIPPLISEFPQSNGTAGVASTSDDRRIQTLKPSTGIPLSIPQSSQTAGSSGAESPNAIHGNNGFYLPPRTHIVSQISVIPHSFGSTEKDSAIIDDQTHTIESSTRIPGLISQTLGSIGSSETQFTHGLGEEHIFDARPRLPPLIAQISRPLELPETQFYTNILGQKQTFHSSDETPFLNPQLTPPVDSSATYSNNVFNHPNPLPTTTESTYFTFEGQYQRPLPFNGFGTPTRQPDRQFVTTPSSKIPAYDFSIEYGSRLKTKTTTISPLGDSEDSPADEFRINVPDPPYIENPYYTQSSILSTTSKPHLSSVDSSKTLVYQSLSVDDANDTLSTVLGHEKQIPVENSEIIPNFATADDQQFSVAADVPDVISSLLLPSENSSFRISIENNVTESTHTEVKAPPTLTLSVPKIDGNNYNLFKPTSGEILPISDAQKPISQNLGPDNWAQYEDDLQFTIRGAIQYPNQFPSLNAISPTPVPPQTAIGPTGFLPDLPSGFTHIQPSLNNNDSPYEISFTISGDEDFDPSGDFINKLLAQHEGNLSLGLEGLGGYEIIKSEDPVDPDVNDVKSTPIPNVEPTVGPTGPLSFDRRGAFGDKPSEIKIGLPDQNTDSGTSILKTRPTKIELPESDNRDAVLRTRPDVKSDGFSITTSSPLIKTFGRKDLQDSVILSKLRTEATDINSSLESLFKFVPPTPESPPLKKEQILEELTKHFGQPLYNDGSQRYSVAPEVSRNVDYNGGQQFADLQKYRVGKNDIAKQEVARTSPAPPKSSTTTTPVPVKTYVETEFIPSLSFSFDSDDGRNEYVEAVLKGIISENQSVDSWNFYRESRENPTSKNRTTKV